MINYITGDATKPTGTDNKIIVHVCNDQGGWGKGFVRAISKRWTQPETEYRKWFKRSNFGLGKVQVIKVEDNLWVANMVAQHGYLSANSIPLQYNELETCLKQVKIWVDMFNASVHMPKIGTGLAGGDWNMIEPIIQKTLSDTNVFIYDLEK